MLRNRIPAFALAALCGIAAGRAAFADNLVSEDFTGTTTNSPWFFFNGACLTASKSAATGDPGTPPGCTADPYYKENLVGGYYGAQGSQQTLPDPSGHGALRFTNGCIPDSYGNCGSGGKSQNGAIISANAYPTNQGLDITFKTLTYRGDSGGTNHDGADGMSFFLMNGNVDPSTNPDDIGSWGGSLGYTCSNSNPDYHGMVGAYLGLGIDEYGNFLNGVSNTLGESGTSATGDNTASGGGYQWNRIGLRGSGNIAFPWLTDNYGSDYPSTLTASQQEAAVRNTCRSGTIWNYSDPDNPQNTGTAIPDYNAIKNAYTVINYNIANEYSTGGYGQLNATPITYRLKITQNGLLSLAYSLNGGSWKGVITNEQITDQNGNLPSSVRFGFAGSTGGDSNIHEILCFKATPASEAASSTTGNEKLSSKLETGVQAYFGLYNPSDWTGHLSAYTLYTSSSGTVTGIAPLANWDGSCVLSGVASGSTCAATGVSGPTAAESPSSRVMLTWDGAQGVPFEWADLSSTEQGWLNAVDSDGQQRLQYLRGDTTNDIQPNGTGLFRDRDSILGDIVDSNPAWVGPPSESPYYAYQTPAQWKDDLYASDSFPENSGQSYTQYASAEQTRLNVVYVGANDGLLHGFAAGSYNTDATYNSSQNTGSEVLAYMPEGVLRAIHPTTTTTSTSGTTSTAIDSGRDYSNPQYGHAFYVDASPGSGDLYYGGSWHTWLVSGLGGALPWTSQGTCGTATTSACASAWAATTTYAAGSTVSENGVNYVANWQSLEQNPETNSGAGEIFALDVTHPSQFAESNAAKLVMGDWIGGTSGNFTCANDSGCALDLGYTYGTPVIRRLHDGNWGIIFGNGLGSSTGAAGIFILEINPTTGAKTMYYLSTGVSGGDGIAYVSPVDIDHDHVVDYVYAGDLKGNVWRFDLTGNSVSSWKAEGPIFTTPTGQPITSQIYAEFVKGQPGNQLMLYFGTGREFPLTNSSATSYQSSQQALYGIWDWNMSAWNALGSTPVASLSTSTAGGIIGSGSPYTMTASNLANRAVTVDSAGNRNISDTSPVCWAGTTTCTSATNSQFGWYINLPGTSSGYNTTTYEQVIYNPLVLSTVVLFNSVLPAIDSPLACSTDVDSGWSYAIDVSTGEPVGFWHGYSSSVGSDTAGVQMNAAGSPYYIGGALVYQDTSGNRHTQQVTLPPDVSGGRETWVQIR